MTSRKTSPPAADSTGTRGLADIAGLLNHTQSIIAFSTFGLFVLSTVVALYFGRTLLMPLLFAVVLWLVLAPLVRRLVRRGLPRHLGAGVVVVALAALVVSVGLTLATPASEWLDRAPQVARQVRANLEVLRRPVAAVKSASEAVEDAATMNDPREKQVVIKAPGRLDLVLAALPMVALETMLTLILLYLMLATDPRVRGTIVCAFRAPRLRFAAAHALRHIEREVSAGLATMTIINAGLGTATAIAMHLLGMPNALLWGVLAAVLNYVPYLGPLVVGAVIGVVGLLSQPTLADAGLAVAAYFALNLVESQLVTPIALGRRLTLSPIAILVAVSFWGLLWGAMGALLAVPLLVVGKVALGEFRRSMERSRPVPLAAAGPTAPRQDAATAALPSHPG
jgi:predicted PurR-regulated permease PerM